jgi:hypothetical protein
VGFGRAGVSPAPRRAASLLLQWTAYGNGTLQARMEACSSGSHKRTYTGLRADAAKLMGLCGQPVLHSGRGAHESVATPADVGLANVCRGHSRRRRLLSDPVRPFRIGLVPCPGPANAFAVRRTTSRSIYHWQRQPSPAGVRPSPSLWHSKRMATTAVSAQHGACSPEESLALTRACGSKWSSLLPGWKARECGLHAYVFIKKLPGVYAPAQPCAFTMLPGRRLVSPCTDPLPPPQADLG